MDRSLTYLSIYLQIATAWEELGLLESNRQGFSPYHVGKQGYCDDLLATHEQEVGR